MKNKLAAIEGILFSMGTSVTRRQLMEALEIDDERFDRVDRNCYRPEYDKEEREESGYWNWMMLISFVPKQNIMDH